MHLEQGHGDMLMDGEVPLLGGECGEEVGLGLVGHQLGLAAHALEERGHLLPL